MQTTSNDHDDPTPVACGSEQSYGYQEAKGSIDDAIRVLPVMAAGTPAFAHGLSRSFASCVLALDVKGLRRCLVIASLEVGPPTHSPSDRQHHPLREVPVCQPESERILPRIAPSLSV